MEAQTIDMNDFVYAGEGANGISYNHRSDPDTMLKMYNENAPLDIIVSELTLAQKVYDCGIPTPKPGTLVTDGKRFGILFERIVDKVSFARAVGDDPSRIEELARRFARFCLLLHGTHLPEGLFPNVKDEYLRMLEDNPYFTQEEKVKVARFIREAPDGDSAIHGDLQFGNALMVGDKDYFIDLGDFNCGHPWFDLGMMCLCCNYDPEDFVQEAFHMTCAQAREFWKYFVKEYFGEDSDVEEVTRKLTPYAGLKVLIIERNAGTYFPAFHALLDDITK